MMGKTDLCNCEEVLSTCCGAERHEFVSTICAKCLDHASFGCVDCEKEQPS